MNWVSSSLQLAGNLLESVDQHAAMTLAGALRVDLAVRIVALRALTERFWL